MGYEAHIQPTDAELAIAARGGDCTCLGVLLERHRARLYAAALRVLGFRPEAEDAVHDRFLIALRHIGDLKDPQAIVGWLHMQDIDIAVYLLVIKLAPFRASGFIDWYNVEFQPRRARREETQRLPSCAMPPPGTIM